MQTVQVRGADGSQRRLALVRREGNVAYVCPLDRVQDVMAGNEEPVVGFPSEDVTDEPERREA
jgi:hypothetical protein